MTRSRSRAQTMKNGYTIKAGVTRGNQTFNVMEETCTDEVSPGDCYNFSVVRNSFSGGVANSKVPHGYYGLNAYDFTLDSITGNWAQCWGPLTSYPGQLPDAVYAAQAVARTNPSRAYVDIPVNVLELGDITTLLRDSGHTLIKKIASNNLRYQFGIRPLVEDLLKLRNFHDQVHRRIKEIERLQSPRGLRRTLELDNLTSTVTRNNEYLQTAGFIARKTYDTVGRRQIKAHVRWKAGGNLVKINQPLAYAQATKAVLGLTLDFATVWEALPWSWMIDWGSNIGDYFKANRNIIPAELVGVWLTKHTTSTSQIPAFETADERITAINVIKETKTRERVIVTPTAHFPFLSGNQLGILASLAITRS